jgi:hypothetical protein
VLPYLGPEIIAFMHATSNSSPNRFAKTPPYVPWQKRGQNRGVAGLVTQSELAQVKDRECPQDLGLLAPSMQPSLNTKADLGWIKNVLAFIGVLTFREEWNHAPSEHVDAVPSENFCCRGSFRPQP